MNKKPVRVITYKNKGIKPNSHMAKPCHELGWCPYGWLVEFFPLNGKTVSWDGTTLDIKPINRRRRDIDARSCNVFGHECPSFYVVEEIEEV